MMNSTGCTVPWLINKTDICTDPDLSKEAFALYQGEMLPLLLQHNNDVNTLAANRRNQHNVCKSPCVFTNMYFGPPVTGPFQQFKVEDDQQYGQLVLYFRKSIKVKVFVLQNQITTC